jgi:predicted RNA-binding protein YlxR (DUF448 family)
MSPQRRCVGCGRIAPKSELIRIAIARDGEPARARAVCDREKRMPGRGAYICCAEQRGRPAAECLKRAIQRGAIARALRSAVSLVPKLVESVSP